MTYKEARVYLDERSKYGSVLGLDTIRGLLHELGDPQDELQFIHIAGTNGKGSVLAYTSTILSEAGYRTGRYVSPTVVSYLERIQVDGKWIPEDRFAEITGQVRDAIVRLEESGKPVPTVFETETAIAFLYFREMKCDVVVLETGLGGALDATNIVNNKICTVFTSISRDHLGVIGNTPEEIARTKAGIMRAGCPAVFAAQKPEVKHVLEEHAQQLGCEIFCSDPSQLRTEEEDFRGMRFSYKEFQSVCISMGGTWQADNAAAALETVRALRARGWQISDAAVAAGMKRTEWPGRFECIGVDPVFILDGTHNENAAVRLRESVDRYFSGRRKICIMGVFRDKEYDRIARIMCTGADLVCTVDLPDRVRGLPAGLLAEEVRKYCRNVSVSGDIGGAVLETLNCAGKEDVILAFGSLSYLCRVKEAYRRIQGRKLR